MILTINKEVYQAIGKPNFKHFIIDSIEMFCSDCRVSFGVLEMYHKHLNNKSEAVNVTVGINHNIGRLQSYIVLNNTVYKINKATFALLAIYKALLEMNLIKSEV